MTIGSAGVVTLPPFPTARGFGSTATLTLDGGTLVPAAASAAYLSGLTNAFLTNNGGTLDVPSGRDIVIGQAFAPAAGQNGTLTKVGAGALTLAGTSTYSGATTVSGGTLFVTGSIAGSAVTVNNTATLGSGTGITGTTGAVVANSGGTLSPGGSIGSLNSGTVTLNGGSTFKLEISTSVLATDLLAASGSLNLAPTNDVVLSISDLSPAAIFGGNFVFLTYNGTRNGGLFSYNNTPVPDDSLITVGSNRFRFDYNFNGNSVALIAVPEPGTLLSLLGGIGTLIGLQRFRRRSRH
jgi:autotransporter-associated beta strand protein